MMKFSYVAAAMLAFALPATAHAGVIISGTCVAVATATQAACSTSTTGGYGNAVTIAAAADASLKVKLTAWQMNQTTSKITSAFLGAYTGGFGVTGLLDSSGSGNLHQIDNVNGYTDFVLLQFNTAVHLDGINVNVYGININNKGVYDADASFSNGSAIAPVAPVAWDSAISLSTYAGSWSNTAVTDQSGSFASSLTDSATGFSKVWLVSASMLTADRDDGFKLSSFTVTRQVPAVPEPATWAMLIFGFGAIGASLRRRSANGSASTAMLA